MFAVLATGPSMSAQVAQSVRHLRCIAVSDAYRLAPWAEAMASQDSKWWLAHPEAKDFAGRKFSGCQKFIDGTEKIATIQSGINSGVLGIRVARALGAKQIVLLGFDGHGSHFFGPHTRDRLKNTDADRQLIHMEQHRQEASDCRFHGIEVWNCTEGTAITAYPLARLEDVCAHGSTCATA